MALACAAGLASGAVLASGDPRPSDSFVDRGSTDVPLQAYAAGQLGVVLPSYDRVYLYAAWRAIMLGQTGLQKHPGAADGMSRAVGTRAEDFSSDPQQPINRWLALSDEVLRRPSPSNWDQMTVKMTADYSSFFNCPQAAFAFAADTLQRLRALPDATPQRLVAWVLAQRDVFGACSYSPQAPQSSFASTRPAPALPIALPPSEPTVWRQMRDYQIAAAYFYRGDFQESSQRFAAIGSTPGHPMQGWGAYLALRSHARQATLGPAPARVLGVVPPRLIDRPELYGPLLTETRHILADARLAPVHEATRANLRSLQYRLVPLQRFAELSALLDDPSQDPNIDDHLGDWLRLANDAFNFLDFTPKSAEQSLARSMRQSHPYFDWMQTLHACPEFSSNPNPDCELPTRSAHALQVWTAAPAAQRITDTDPRRVWLVATLMLADALTPPLETAALAVPPSAPEYLTVRYNLARLYRLAGSTAKAHTMADSGLQAIPPFPAGSRSARNLFRQERLGSATSLAEGAPFIDRELLAIWNPDTYERIPAYVVQQPDDDGLTLLNSTLSVQDLLVLSQDQHLAPQTRSRIAIAAWMRADLLGESSIAEAAAEVAVKTTPALKPVADRYLSGRNAADRHHWLIVSALNYKLSVTVSTTERPGVAWDAKTLPKVRKDEVVAAMWCNAVSGEDPYTVRSTVPSPDLSTHKAERDREILALKKLKTATGHVADDVLPWARSHPEDPDVPWLLHVVVVSTRGGCLDADASKISKTAFQLLHTRYKNSEWTKKTPVWY